MKRLISIVCMVTIIAVTGTDLARAASVSSNAIPVSASIANTLSLDVVLKQNITTGATLASANFGTLQPLVQANGSKTLRSSTTGSTGTGAVVVMVSGTFNGGTPYNITSAGTQLTSGANALPGGACAIVPTYNAADNGGAVLVGVVGASGTWTNAAAKTLYTSNATGSARTITCFMSITDDPAAGATAAVPFDQAAGNYNGTITFTITA